MSFEKDKVNQPDQSNIKPESQSDQEGHESQGDVSIDPPDTGGDSTTMSDT